MEDLPEGYPSGQVGGPRFGDQQIVLGSVLQEKRPLLSGMYLGALYVLNAGNNPDRLALAAHGLRELMEKLTLYYNVPASPQSSMQKKLPSLKEKVRQLQDHWQNVQKNSKCRSNPGWSGEIDKPLLRFLTKVEEFFTWVVEERPARKQQTASTLRVLDPLPLPLPGLIEELRIEEWERCHNYFQGVAHHTINSSYEEFMTWVAVLERFLLDRLYPRTFDDHRIIDELIKEGETDAQP
jgi:hypothetical protein